MQIMIHRAILTCAITACALLSHAETHRKYYLNKWSFHGNPESPAFHDASYWNDENGNPGESGGALDTSGDYYVIDYLLQSDNESQGATPTFECHSLTIGEVGGGAPQFDCYLSKYTKWSVGGEGLVFANGSVQLCWKPVTVDAKVTVLSPTNAPFSVFSQYVDTKIIFSKAIVSAAGAGMDLYNNEEATDASTFTVELTGDYSQYLGVLRVGKSDANAEKPNDIYLKNSTEFPGTIALRATGRLQAGSSNLRLGSLVLEDGATIVVSTGTVSVAKSFAIDGTAAISVNLSAGVVDSLLARREYGQFEVLRVPSASQVSAENFAISLAPANSRVASVAAVVVDNGDCTKSVCCRLLRPCVYVKPDGSNSATGADAENAFRTLAYAVSQLKDGVVYALEGTYDEGLCDEGEGMTHSRVHVPTNVALKAIGGASNTVIKGAAPSGTTALKGEGATRCVRLDDGAMIQGFTLTGGHGWASDVEVDGEKYVNQIGGGVCGRGDSLVLDCIITNNFAQYGGGVHGGRYVRCLLKGNYTITSGGARSQWQGRDGYGYPYNSHFYNCLFGSTDGNSVLVYYNCYLYNCTFAGTAYQSPQHFCSLYNCIVPGSTLIGGGNVSYVNCLLGSEPSNPKTMEGSRVVSDWTSVMDASFRPLAGGLAVNGGSNSCYQATYPPEAGPVDYFGGQRIYEDAIDIGCGEYDPRASFARVLSSVRLSVSTASAGVCISPGGDSVVIPDSDVLVIEYNATGSAAQCEVHFEAEVTDGVLTVSLDGRQWVELGSGSHSLTFQCDQSTTRLAFSYEGTGEASVGKFRRDGGMVLLFR